MRYCGPDRTNALELSEAEWRLSPSCWRKRANGAAIRPRQKRRLLREALMESCDVSAGERAASSAIKERRR